MRTEVFTCDKCGAEFGHGHGATAQIPGAPVFGIMGKRPIAHTAGEMGGHHDVDLCSGCLRKLNEFLAPDKAV